MNIVIYIKKKKCSLHIRSLYCYVLQLLSYIKRDLTIFCFLINDTYTTIKSIVSREVLSWDPNEISEFAINKKELFCFLLFRTAEYFVNKMFMHRLEGN